MTDSSNPIERRDTRRRFEQWAQNPGCEANTRSAILGVPMLDVARAEGSKDPFGQSPFALARGQAFEAGILKNGAERLLEALVTASVLPPGARGLLDLRQRRFGGNSRDLDQAIERTAQHLSACAGPKPPSIAVIAGAALRVPGELMLPEAVLVIDALIVRTDGPRPVFVVGEVKTYPDRGGFTDADQLATARAQAGVYAHALQLTIEEARLGDRLDVSPTGFLVLSRPGSNMPSVRADEDLRYQIERAARGFATLRSLARQLGRPDGDKAQLVREAPTQYSESCLGFCERATLCRDRAVANHEPAALGEQMSHWLGDIRLDRAIALMGGAAPTSSAERDLLSQLREGGFVS
jgi:hypothetical protein